MTDPTPLAVADAPEPVIATAPPAATAARWEDFIDIFYAPSSVFARRENAGFGVPMLVVTVLGGLVLLATFNAMAPIMDAEFSRQTAAMVAKGATPEMLEKSRAFSGVAVRIGAFIVPPIMMMLTGVVLWMAGRLVGAVGAVSTAIMVVAYANVPRIVGAILGGAQALMMDPARLDGRHRIALDPARFMDPATTSPVLMAIAGRFDLFTLWATILLGIGLAVTGRIPRSRAFLAAAIVWVVGGLPELLGALRQ